VREPNVALGKVLLSAGLVSAEARRVPGRSIDLDILFDAVLKRLYLVKSHALFDVHLDIFDA